MGAWVDETKGEAVGLKKKLKALCDMMFPEFNEIAKATKSGALPIGPRG